MLGELGAVALAGDPELLTLTCGVLRGSVALIPLAGAWVTALEG